SGTRRPARRSASVASAALTCSCAWRCAGASLTASSAYSRGVATMVAPRGTRYQRCVADDGVAARDRKLVEPAGDRRGYVDELAFDVPLVAGRRGVGARANNQGENCRRTAKRWGFGSHARIDTTTAIPDQTERAPQTGSSQRDVSRRQSTSRDRECIPSISTRYS